MGLISGLLTLPLAPVRGTVWIAEKVQEQAETERLDESTIHAGLQEVAAARAQGDDDPALDEVEDELIRRLMELRAIGGEEHHGV